MKKVFSLFAAALFAGTLFAAPISFTFVTSGSTSDGTNSKTEVADIFATNGELVTITTATKIMQGQDGWGMKMGNSSTDGLLEFTLNTPVVLDSIVAEAAGFSATENTLKINDNELTLGGAKGVFVSVKVECDGATSVSSIKLEGAHRAYVKLLTLYVHEGEGPVVGDGIHYVLDGGQFNPDGWMSEEDMYQGLAADVLAANGNGYTFAFVGGFGTDHTNFGPADVSGATGLALDISTWDMTFLKGYENGKWGWLEDYIVAKSEDAGKAWNSSSAMRYALAAFFSNSVRATWPASADYTNCGISSDLWRGAWGYTFGNPSTVAEGETVTLISPYKPGYIFRGWYSNSDFTGDAVTTITSATTGVLYAKWEENTATEITYVLNGGVANDYGWATPEDMYQGLAADIYASKDADCPAFAWASDFTGTFGTPDISGTTGPAHDIQAFDLTFWTNHADKWGWLGEYLNETAIAAGQTNTAITNGSYARYALAAFFGNTIRPNWPASADYTNTGVNALDAYQAYWKHSFNNPASVTEETALYAPYMEGYTFEGWYAAEDFSGPKVTTIDATTVGTLYAKFVEYIPTVKEIVAMEDSVNTKVKGIVNHIQGKTLYVTDATGGLLVYCKANPTCQVGDVITANGMKVTYYGAPEVSGAEITATETGKLADPINMTIGDLVANPMKYLSQRVSITGVKIVAYDSYNNPTVKEGTDEVLCYKVVLDPVAFPIGKKVNFTAVVGYHDALQFVGNAADFSLAMAAGKDAATYEVKTSETGATYTLTNDWLYSNYLGNFAANKPNPLGEQCRSMVVKNGIMYFPWRYANETEENARLIRVDAATGEMMDPLVLADSVMRQYTPLVMDTVVSGTDTTITATATKVWETTGNIIFASCSDLKMDEAGHLLLMNLQTGNVFQVWEIDETTGAAKCLIYMGGNSGVDGLAKLYPDAASSDGNIRADRMGVLGDVHADGSIFLAQNANGNVYRYDFVDGVFDGMPTLIGCADPTDDSGEKAADFGDAPQIYPVSDELFYVDGAKTFPTLYDGDGNALASFVGDDEKAILLAADAKASESPNGVREFELNGEYFMVMAGSNYDAGDGVANSTTLVFKCLDENRNFNEMTPYWTLPQDGMSQVNRQGVDPQRVCVSQVDVDEANHTATIYIYAAEQGYGKYTLVATPVIDGVENLEVAEGVEKLIQNGQVYIIKNGVRYSVLGQVVE